MARRWGCVMAELVFFSGPMDCGKSTLALQMDYNHAARGLAGLIFAKHDRAGTSVLSSRLGLTKKAQEVVDDLDFWDAIVSRVTTGQRVDYLICRWVLSRGQGEAAPGWLLGAASSAGSSLTSWRACRYATARSD
jgi:hypothetical protein